MSEKSYDDFDFNSVKGILHHFPMPFGKYSGTSIKDLETTYISFLLEKMNLDEQLVFLLKFEIISRLKLESFNPEYSESVDFWKYINEKSFGDLGRVALSNSMEKEANNGKR